MVFSRCRFVFDLTLANHEIPEMHETCICLVRDSELKFQACDSPSGLVPDAVIFTYISGAYILPDFTPIVAVANTTLSLFSLPPHVRSARVSKPHSSWYFGRRLCYHLAFLLHTSTSALRYHASYLIVTRLLSTLVLLHNHLPARKWL